jgi:hypothetical protein
MRAGLRSAIIVAALLIASVPAYALVKMNLAA